MPIGLLTIGFIFLVLFLLCKIIRFAFKVVAKGFRIFRYETTTRNTAFPQEERKSYSISQNDFARISTRTAYRHRRVENVEIDDTSVSIEFASQTGLTKNHAVLTFILSGPSFGDYSIRSDNPDSTIPETIGLRIQDELRNVAKFS